MFISRLKDKFYAYDKYGEHRTNGVKVLFVLEFMMVFYFFSSITNPYFYYFFVPLTCFAAEVAGTSLEEKYLYLFSVLTGSIITIFLFDVLSIYKTFFVFFAFFYALTIYYVVLNKLPTMILVVPAMLGLGSYSLIYVGHRDSNFYVALNHSLNTLSAMGVMFLALFLFPQKYYFFIWRRAFLEVIDHMEDFFRRALNEEAKTVPIFPGVIMMQRYAQMLSRKMKYYTIVRITMLTFELVMGMSYILSFQKHMKMGYVRVFHEYLVTFNEACKKYQPVILTPWDFKALQLTYELRLMHKLILSWNYLCANH